MVDITTDRSTPQCCGEWNRPTPERWCCFWARPASGPPGGKRCALDYECYPDMARAKLAELEAEARTRWPLVGCAIVHRVGQVEIGEASVGVAVSTRAPGQRPSKPANG